MDMHWHDLQGAENLYAGAGCSAGCLNILFKHKWKIFAVTATVLAAALYVSLAPSLYLSESSWLIKVGRNASLDPAVGPIFPIAQQRENESTGCRSRAASSRNGSWMIGPEYASAERITGARARWTPCAGVGAEEPKTRWPPRLIAVLYRGTGGDAGAGKPGCGRSKTATSSRSRCRKPPETASAGAGYILMRTRSITRGPPLAGPARFLRGASARMRERINAGKEMEDYRPARHGSVAEQKTRSPIGGAAGTDTLGAGWKAPARASRYSTDSREPAEPVELNRTEGKTNYYADALREELMKLKVQETQLAGRYADSNKNLKDLREQIKLLESLVKQANTTHTEVTSGVDTNQKSIQHLLNLEQSELEAVKDQEKYLLES